MNGRRVVVALLGSALLCAALFWTIALDIGAEVTRQAEGAGVPKLSREEAAVRAAQDDMFGLPSRLPDAPARNIERAWKEGTPEHPFPASADGVATLFEAYAVSVKGCRAQLPSPEKDGAKLPIYVTLQTVDGYGRVAAIDGFGEGTRARAFAHCLTGGVRPAFFESPTDGEVTLAHALNLRP
jgi:hypothetical protein